MFGAILRKSYKLIVGLVKPVFGKGTGIVPQSMAESYWLTVLTEEQRGWSIEKLERELGKLPQLELPLVHTFSGGVYIRELTIPKGAIIIGKRHRHETCNILMKGELELWVGEGLPTRRIKGPLLFTSPPLTKKAAVCIEEAVFMNIHPTEETDLEKIEAHFIIPEKEYLELNHQKELIE